MITCDELEQRYAKGIFGCTAAERSAAQNHIDHCAKCRGEVIARLQEMRRNRSPEENFIVRMVAHAIKELDQQDPEVAKE